MTRRQVSVGHELVSNERMRTRGEGVSLTAIRNGRVEVVLLSVFVDAEAFKVDVPARTELRLDRTGNVNGRLGAELGHAALHDGELDGDFACHLDGAAEGDLRDN